MRHLKLSLLSLILLCGNLSAGLDPSYSEKAVIDTVPFFAGGTYDRSIPSPNEYTQHPIGEWPLRYFEMVPFIKEIAATSDRVKIEIHGTTHEGRNLYNLFISSKENIARLEEIRMSMTSLANPESGISKSERERLYEELPAVAWLGYSVHGDEISGVDAATQLIYQLAAGTDSLTQSILENVIVIIDPIQNPDGRERYLSMLQTYKSDVPNYNRRAKQHSGVWPWGRANHYLFDLNRDWILLTQPETIGKVKTIQKWNPQMTVDAHEMGSNSTYLFSPPREPINYNTASNIKKWGDKFAADQANAFDKNGWPYYVGEWHEQWYPGYASAWPTFFGSIAILYEQAGVDGQFVKQQDDYILTYHQAVNQQFTSSFSNLRTLADNREDIMRDYVKARAKIIDDGRKSGLNFIFPPDRDEIKMKRFIERIMMQGIEVKRARKSFTAEATNIYGNIDRSHSFPAGTYVVSTAQVNGALAKSFLEFDPRLKLSFLKEERRYLEKYNETRMYEVSAWSVPLAYGLDAFWSTSRLGAQLETVSEVKMSQGSLHNPDATVGWIFDMVGEKTYLMMARLFGKDVVMHASEKAFTIEGKKFASGSIFVRRRTNSSEVADILAPLADEIGLDIWGVNTMASSDGSYLGAPTFGLLRKPEVALVTGDGISFTGVGALWFTIDKELGFPHSLIDLSAIRSSNLDLYNVIVFPGAWGGLSDRIGKSGTSNIKKWVEDGGTLICEGSAATWAADSSTGLSQVSLMRQKLDKLDEYKKFADREKNAESPKIDTMALWHPEKVASKEKDDDDKKSSSEDNKIDKDADEWNRRFSPGGAILRVDLDTEHWLSFGMKKTVPVMVYTTHAFLSKKPVSTVGRFAEANDLRISGLLWPEGRARWAGTSYLTRERKGRGQIILMATHPNQRAYFYGTRALFVNAMLYGPGMGTSFEGPSSQQGEH